MPLRIGIRVALALAAVTIGGAWLLEGRWLPAGIMGVLALVGDLGRARTSPQLTNLAFAGTLAIAVIGVVESVMPGAMFAGTLAALTAWDLCGLQDRLQQADHVGATARLQVRHFERLLVVLAVGGGLGAVAMVGALSLGFGGALGLGLVAVIGLRWLLRATARNLH